MQDHISEVIGIVLGVVSPFLAALVWFWKRDRKNIDAELTDIHSGLKELKRCLDKDMEDVMEQVNNVEHNYVERLDSIKDSISDLKVDMAKLFGDLKATLAREYMSKEEAERAYNHIKGMGRNT